MTSITNNIKKTLTQILEKTTYDRLFILTDNNTEQYCLPILQKIPAFTNAHTISVPAGDENKTIYTAIKIWEAFSTQGATRHSLLINIGGGMITDLGGFTASTFKRGFNYINVSTTLLGAVDAATGGKTGVNFLGLKNEIGVFKPALHVLVATELFNTLDSKNIRSGFAEMLKHALISTDKDWADICRFDLENLDMEMLTALLKRNIAIKQHIVNEDPTEKGIRKALNFGHTIGHAIESLSYQTGTPLLHGYAILYGCVTELYLSFIKLGFPKGIIMQLVQIMKQYYGVYNLSCKQYDKLYGLMMHDKKNNGQEINFTLLKNIGEICIDQTATKDEIFEALDFMREG